MKINHNTGFAILVLTIFTQKNKMAYEIIWLNQGVIVKYKGVLSADEVFKANNEITIHPDFGLLKSIIFNYLDARVEW